MFRLQRKSAESLRSIFEELTLIGNDAEDEVQALVRNELTRMKRYEHEAIACRNHAHELLRKFGTIEDLATEEKENVPSDEHPLIIETPLVRRAEYKPKCLRPEASDDVHLPTRVASSSTVVSLVRPITASEFRMIPNYQKGRMTVEDLNKALTVLEKLWVENNQLMKTHPKTLSSTARNQKIALTTQATQAEGSQYFCSEKDWRDALDSRIRTLSTKILPCLRHVSRIKCTRLRNAVVLISHVEE
ncbi:hypothetical protein QR680_009278 [Steinernema hermaphroditum]|uniref:SKA complex subunit 1 n=1 Tax=Steinernema hermaphroditum TaxID=289476 RepID=A0AA39ILH9_9BILA|nr:hypothetical protein QR680_009278 [Steinernema hermaphroditum]